MHRQPTEAIDPLALLTPRELQITALLSRGELNKEIAAKLKISEYTVATYLKQIYNKLNVRNRTAVAFLFAAAVSREKSN
jgi:DNA-binding NarL/FixJ family response regulator